MAKTKKKTQTFPTPKTAKKSYFFDSTTIDEIGPTLRDWREFNELSRFEMDDLHEDELVSYHTIQRVEEADFPNLIKALRQLEGMAEMFGYEVSLQMRKKQ